ncbi:hypothetical protein SARC_11257 [Sphaeroforma arctica JP610]|uniref:2'-phosphotransferase n=1 Tax=Sphaeroforma arctica JP610 TaxID=667725 RepID=A0A0L0FHK6_9EUKA|nr:hypothetical protein SARC_11257 [Sphaeroforma arctica JP610]KNC76235.1 hypothetical protein SARC_11257 [Sphaeroforma arctica JP610]|eukprot:XP_014150137.1 hypothetical protein SARC_11257 [Sphaeroforma arctica JP610]
MNNIQKAEEDSMAAPSTPTKGVDKSTPKAKTSILSDFKNKSRDRPGRPQQQQGGKAGDSSITLGERTPNISMSCSISNTGNPQQASKTGSDSGRTIPSASESHTINSGVSGPHINTPTKTPTNTSSDDKDRGPGNSSSVKSKPGIGSPGYSKLNSSKSGISNPGNTKLNSSKSGGRQRRGGSNEQTMWSRKLSYVLRHGAERDGVPIGADGFVKIKDLTSHKKFKGLTLDIIQQVAKQDTKGRYKLEERDGEMLVRANQGHSIAHVSDLELTPVLSATTYPVCIHGTFRKAWDLIKESGLKTMNRNQIHCARGLPGESGVISGMRASCQVLIYIDMAASIKDGMEWFASANDVILTSGFDGVIPPMYFSSVVTNKGASLL